MTSGQEVKACETIFVVYIIVFDQDMDMLDKSFSLEDLLSFIHDVVTLSAYSFFIHKQMGLKSLDR